MASISLSSIRKDACNGHSVMLLAIDGKAFFSFIAWMQHTQADCLSLNEGGSKDTLNVARALVGLPLDMRYSFAQALKAKAAQLFARQQSVAAEMAKARYVRQLQCFAAYHAQSAQNHVIAALHQDDNYSGVADTYRERAIRDQRTAAARFQAIAGVLGLFDTPCMDDAHAVECEPSKVEAAKPEPMADKRASYREKAFNAYGRYAVYCARADVAPYPFPEWFADLYMGNETNPACNWN